MSGCGGSTVRRFRRNSSEDHFPAAWQHCRLRRCRLRRCRLRRCRLRRCRLIAVAASAVVASAVAASAAPPPLPPPPLSLRRPPPPVTGSPPPPQADRPPARSPTIKSATSERNGEVLFFTLLCSRAEWAAMRQVASQGKGGFQCWRANPHEAAECSPRPPNRTGRAVGPTAGSCSEAESIGTFLRLGMSVTAAMPQRGASPPTAARAEIGNVAPAWGAAKRPTAITPSMSRTVPRLRRSRAYSQIPHSDTATARPPPPQKAYRPILVARNIPLHIRRTQVRHIHCCLDTRYQNLHE